MATIVEDKTDILDLLVVSKVSANWIGEIYNKLAKNSTLK